MKKIFTFLTLGFLSAPIVFMNTACDPTTNTITVRDTIYLHIDCFDCMGAVACYPFSGNANDSSGYDRHGTVVGATLTTDRFGKPNSAYYFGDSVTASQYIQLPTYTTIMGSSEEFSISFWCKYGGADRGPNPISLFPDIGGDRLAIAVPYHPNDSPSDIYWDYGNLASGRLTTTVVADANWHHYVCIKSAAFNVMEIYRDNVKIATKAGYDNLGNKGRNFRVGGASDVGWFVGAIDDIRIFDKRLSPSEVTKLYNDN
jgi:Concanavalin A-like lectin/glucanases superfamily